jgi:hypothetical protein
MQAAWTQRHRRQRARAPPDYFDRETGYRDKATGRPVPELRQPEHGDVPGHDRGAERINEPGPC